jgi:opacity protein-like surface antigen
MGKRLLALLGLLIAFTTTAEAQERGFIIGEVGLTFAEKTDALFGVEAGFSVTNNLQIVGLYERMQDTLTGDLTQFLRLLGQIGDVNIEGTLPTNYLAGGVRYNFGGGGAVYPYFQFEVGVGQIDPNLRFISKSGEDVTDQTDFSLSETNAAVALCAGVRGNIGSVMTIEVAYKWLNINTDETLKINRFHFGIGAHF